MELRRIVLQASVVQDAPVLQKYLWGLSLEGWSLLTVVPCDGTRELWVQRPMDEGREAHVRFELSPCRR